MSSALFAYPKQAAFQRVLPKSKIYEHAKPSRAVRERFVAEVGQIVWQYKLSPETTNLRARNGISEIQVFGVELKGEEVSEAVLRCIDKAISFPIFYELAHGDRIKAMAGYKRPNDAEADKWVVDAYFETAWKATNEVREPLPVALDLAGLYELMLRAHIGLPPRDGETVRDVVTRAQAIREKETECRKLEQRLAQEPQFNRKVELNGQLRAAKDELTSLRG